MTSRSTGRLRLRRSRTERVVVSTWSTEERSISTPSGLSANILSEEQHHPERDQDKRRKDRFAQLAPEQERDTYSNQEQSDR